MEKLAEGYGGKLKIVEIDASKNKHLWLSLKVLGLPTFLIYKDRLEVDRLNGGDLKIEEIIEKGAGQTRHENDRYR